MLELKGISKQLGDFRLHNIDLRVEDREYLMILGPTGTGKTVILEIIAGMYPPDTGQICFGGKNITCCDPEERQIGFVYQDYLLFPHLDVRANILFGLKVRKTPRLVMQSQLDQIVGVLRISHLLNRYPATLSGGEKQRVALARALITRPKLLLLDEPLSALDPQTREVFRYELKNIHTETGMTTIHITHDFTEAVSLADRIVVMRDGRIEQVGIPGELFDRPQSQFVARFLGAENIYEGKVVVDNGVKAVQIGGVRLATVTECEGQVSVTIRPEDIILSREMIHSSARNCLKGRVTEIIPLGAIVKVKLDTGITLTGLITRTSAEDIGIFSGQTLYAIFKSVAVHVYHGH